MNQIESRPKKTRQGRGKHSKFAATSRNKAREKIQRTGEMIKVDMSEQFRRTKSLVTQIRRKD